MPNTTSPTAATSTSPTVMIYARTAAAGPQGRRALQRDARRLEQLAATMSACRPIVVAEHAHWEMSGPVSNLAHSVDILLIPSLDRLTRGGLPRLSGMLQALRTHHTRVLSLTDEHQIRAGRSLDELDLTEPHDVRPVMNDEMHRLDDRAALAAFQRRLALGRAAAGSRRTSA